jgi:transcriptional regulator with XRE-family HTH domain
VSFGIRIKELREELGFTQAELAVKSGVPLVELVKIEAGELFPDVRHITNIGKALGKHEGFLLKDFLYKK